MAFISALITVININIIIIVTNIIVAQVIMDFDGMRIIRIRILNEEIITLNPVWQMIIWSTILTIIISIMRLPIAISGICTMS